MSITFDQQFTAECDGGILFTKTSGDQGMASPSIIRLFSASLSFSLAISVRQGNYQVYTNATGIGEPGCIGDIAFFNNYYMDEVIGLNVTSGEMWTVGGVTAGTYFYRGKFQDQILVQRGPAHLILSPVVGANATIINCNNAFGFTSTK